MIDCLIVKKKTNISENQKKALLFEHGMFLKESNYFKNNFSVEYIEKFLTGSYIAAQMRYINYETNKIYLNFKELLKKNINDYDKYSIAKIFFNYKTLFRTIRYDAMFRALVNLLIEMYGKNFVLRFSLESNINIIENTLLHCFRKDSDIKIQNIFFDSTIGETLPISYIIKINYSIKNGISLNKNLWILKNKAYFNYRKKT